MNKKQKKMLIRIIVAAVLVVLFSKLPIDGYVRFGLFMIPYLVIGYDILQKAFKGIRNKQVFDENFLMAVATVGAILLGDYSEGVAVMLFYQIGELFQSYAVGKSRRNISELMDIRPDYANIEVDGKLEQVDPDEVEVGTVIVVQPGEKVPIDGVIIDGVSTLNTSALTGESLPRDAKAGDEVISGCINMTGVLKIRTIREFGESTVSKILELVENSSSRKSKSENFISKFAKYYTPAVCYGALALAILPPLITQQPFSTWIYRALTFLVISCPCALVISIPLSFFGGIGGASKLGVLIKGSNYLETLADVDTVVFDKTGTLTQGKPVVTDCRPAPGVTEEELLCVAASLEKPSEHPLADAITAEAQARNIPLAPVEDFLATPGRGIRGVIQGQRLLAGNRAMLEEAGVPLDGFDAVAEGLAQAGKTPLYFAGDGRMLGVVAVADTPKPTSAEAVRAFQAMGIDVVMLTGDNRRTAEAVGRQLGVNRVVAEVLPQDKEKTVAELQAQGKRVAMVGDGINDAPALKRAFVGIAMGGVGSDIAVDAADIVLVNDRVEELPHLLALSRRMMTTIRLNLAFSMALNLVAIVLAMTGVLNPVVGALVHNAGSVLVILNSALLLKWRRRS